MHQTDTTDYTLNMTPEQELQLNTLMEKVERLESATNTDNNELVIENLIKRRTDVDDTKVNRAISVGAGGGTVNTFDYPDDFIEIKYKGVLYRIPAYNATRFI